MERRHGFPFSPGELPSAIFVLIMIIGPIVLINAALLTFFGALVVSCDIVDIMIIVFAVIFLFSFTVRSLPFSLVFNRLSFLIHFFLNIPFPFSYILTLISLLALLLF